MELLVHVYEKPGDGGVRLVTCAFLHNPLVRWAPTRAKATSGLIEDLRRYLRTLDPAVRAQLDPPAHVRLERVHLELTLRDAGRKKLTGTFPLVVEPRWATREARVRLVYHPERPQYFLTLLDGEDDKLADLASKHFSYAWESLSEEEIRALQTEGKDRLRTLAFDAVPQTLKDAQQRGATPNRRRRDPEYKPPLSTIPRLGVDLTKQAIDGALARGMPRPRLEERLRAMLVGERPRSLVLVGAPGTGKSTLLHALVHDLLATDDFPSHRNADRVRHVWSLSARRLIAGMSYLGDWEQRVAEVIAEARAHRVILRIEDVAQLGRVGRSRDSDRSLADLFRGPIANGEITVLGEATVERLSQLEEDAPQLAEALQRLYVDEATASETYKMLLHETRQLETQHALALSPLVAREIVETGGALFPGLAQPGKSLETLRQLAGTATRDDGADTYVGRTGALELLAQRTGLSERVLDVEDALDVREVNVHFAAQVIGQDAAVGAVVDLVARVKTGLVDPRRPHGVYLFTGPTGTGKTEMAKALAQYLYGDATRLVRFDMGEYGGPDAAARLVGDAWSPEGLLTRRVQEQPFCVLLLDEIEKAHRAVLYLLLQVFDEGRLTDASGKTADFSHTVIVMTSNLGAKSRSAIGFGGESAESVLLDVARAVREFFPPELFNRIDRIVPFRPLDRATAERIVRRELGLLVSRRGLVERKIAARVTDAVVTRAVREAFDARDGARALKRWLEDHVAGLLAEQVATGAPARLRVLHVHERDGALAVHAESMTERAPADARYLLAELEGAEPDTLVARVRELARDVQTAAESVAAERLAQRVGEHLAQMRSTDDEHAERVVLLDAMRSALQTFRERMAELLPDEVEEERERIGDEEDAEQVHTFRSPSYRRGEKIVVRSRTRVSGEQSATTQRALLEALAEACFLRRAMDTLDDPAQHAVMVEIARVGVAAGERFAEAHVGWPAMLAAAYQGARGELEQAATASGGALREGLDDAARADRIVLRITGLAVRDFFSEEHGTHLWQPLSGAPSLAVVRVRPASAKESPLDALRAHDAGVRAFEAALESGAPLPPNPDALLPLVRTLRFELVAGTFAPNSPVDLEDYGTGLVSRVRARSLREALDGLWRMRMSRLDTGAQ